ncbi:MAG: NAD(P)-dependent oxidoreductase [Desulfobacterales bacterium]|nr:NAD(P)-dependent oxidoreductase [Desulfobacterales bacterium]
MSNKCVLVTGGSGFIGIYLMKKLAEQGNRVINYDLAPPSPVLQRFLDDSDNAENISFQRGSILDLPDVMAVAQDTGVDKIVHMAAFFDPAESNRRPYFTYQANVFGTINILEAARLLKMSRVVNISSIGVYPKKQFEPMDENHPMFILGAGHGSHYGSSKAASEMIGQAYCENNNVSYVSVRFSGVYGYGMRYSMFIKDMIENSLQNAPTVFKTGGNLTRDYTYVKDSVDGVICALEADDSDLVSRTYLTTSGQLYSGTDVAEIVTKLIPGASITIEPELSAFEEKDMAKRGKIDISLAQKELGYEPKYSIEDGIKEYIETYKQYSEN